MLELTQQSLAFQQERSQLTEMLQAQHVHMQQLVEENQTQEAALNGLSRHAQQADQQVQTDITITGLAMCFTSLHHQDLDGNVQSYGASKISRQVCLQACCQSKFKR